MSDYVDNQQGFWEDSMFLDQAEVPVVDGSGHPMVQWEYLNAYTRDPAGLLQYPLTAWDAEPSNPQLAIEHVTTTPTFYSTDRELPVEPVVRNDAQSGPSMEHDFALAGSIEAVSVTDAAAPGLVGRNTEAATVFYNINSTLQIDFPIHDDTESRLSMQDWTLSDDPIEAIPGTEVTPPESIELVTKQTQSLKCNHPGCKSTASFRGDYELNRHKELHERDPLFCPVLGCTKPKRSPRLDKFRDHIRSHGELALVKCRIPSCAAQPKPLHLYEMHLFSHEFNIMLKHCRSDYIWGDFSAKRICPISSCHKFMEGRGSYGGTSKLAFHLAHEHDERDRQAQRSSVWDMGIDPSNCDFICPVCLLRIPVANISENDVQLHVLSHCVDISHLEIYLTGLSKQSGSNLTSRRRTIFSSVENYLEHKIYYNYFDLLFRKQFCFPCPHCHFAAEAGLRDDRYVPFNTNLREHPGMLIQNEALKQKRTAIVRIVPALDMHPMFDDLKVQQA